MEDQLQKENQELRLQVAHLQQELQRARSHALELSKAVEFEEEAITNRLVKKLEQLQKEKEQLATAIEQEEEAISNSLMRKLSHLQQSKVDLEQSLEVEEEFIVNKLQKQIAQLQTERDDLQRMLGIERNVRFAELDGIIDRVASSSSLATLGSSLSMSDPSQLSVSRSSSVTIPSEPAAAADPARSSSMDPEIKVILSKVESELGGIRDHYRRFDSEFARISKLNEDLRTDVRRLSEENVALTQQLRRARSGSTSPRNGPVLVGSSPAQIHQFIGSSPPREAVAAVASASTPSAGAVPVAATP